MKHFSSLMLTCQSPKRIYAFQRRLNATTSPLILALALMLGATWDAGRCYAGTFPASPEDETTNSMGVFRIIVEPGFRYLLERDVPNSLLTYPGYNSGDPLDPDSAGLSSPPYSLTSPVLFDQATVISVSAGFTHSLTGPASPIPVGGPPPGGNPPVGSYDYSSYSCGGRPFGFVFPAPPTPREVLTAIRKFELHGFNCAAYSGDPRIPSNSIPSVNYVVAGPAANIAGPGTGVALPSLGIVQSTTIGPDFPAKSFFNIFVEVNIPSIPFTKSFAVPEFPPLAPEFPTPNGVAVLYNDCAHPLVIVNNTVNGLPPDVVYIHNSSTAVPLKFKYGNPPYWNADAIFGYVVLAGHGLFACGAKSSAFLDNVLGAIGTSAPQMPIAWLFPNNKFPPPASEYSSVGKIDILKFTTPQAGTLYVRNIRHRNLTNPISPPSFNTTATYTVPNSIADMEVSPDNANWFAAQGNGSLTMTIHHGDATNDTPTMEFYDTEMTALNLTCTGPFSFLIRESPTKVSSGKHTIESTVPGIRASSFCDVNYQISTDVGQNWVDPDRALRTQILEAPCGGGASLDITPIGTNLKISWTDPSYHLESRPSLLPSSSWTPVPGASPITLPATGTQMFFRLSCP